ncbi:MAG: hypothetical protein HY985_04650 [Magnetospirillum sp.]|nr:hypothetical protein [Magnetospirillum sp.]
MTKAAEPITAAESMVMVVGIGTLLYVLSGWNYLAYHTMAELFAAVVGFGTFTVAWHGRRLLGSPYLIMGVAAMVVAVIDLMHALAFKGMGLVAENGGNTATQLWILGRTLECAALLWAVARPHRNPEAIVPLAVFALLGALGLTSILAWDIFPDCFVDGRGLTPFKIATEYAVMAGYGIGAILLARYRHLFDASVFWALMAAIAFRIAAEGAFTLYVTVTGPANFAGHLFKIMATWFVYRALVVKGIAQPHALMVTTIESDRLLTRQVKEHAATLERVLAEQARLQADLRRALSEAHHADGVKMRFLAAASHDLRQPLQALRLFLDILDGRLREERDKAVLGQAFSALTSIDDLMQSLMHLSQLQTGIVEVKRRRVAVATLFHQLEAEWSGPAEARGLCLRVAQSSATIDTDPVLLLRMLRNLVVNAIRYTPSGVILLGCRRETGGGVRIEVHDTGPGIPEAERERIFDEFYRLPAEDGNRPEGLGLGLSIVRHTAALLGHRVTMRSTLGKGSTFAVVITPGDAERARMSPG